MDQTQFNDARQHAIETLEFFSREHKLQEKFLERFKRWREPFYGDDIDPDEELNRIKNFLKTNPTDEIIRKRIKELLSLKVKKQWFGKWFKNTIFDKGKEKTQYIFHSNPQWKWVGFPETVFCDTIFITFEKDTDEPRIKKFDDMLFNIDHAESWYQEVKSKGIINKLNKLING